VNVTLDVNGSGYALGTYLPGYEGGVAKLHTGDSFKSNSYSGPQPLILVIPGIDPAIADAATFRILNPTSYEGYCGNALIATGTTPADDAKNREDDFSFAADGDDRETEATVANGAIRAPIFCKDYGAWCEVEVILRKGTAVLGPPFTITLPLDRNHDRLADGWQYAENLKWNAQFNPATPRPAGADGRALVNPDLDDEEIDPDGRNGDGGRDLPAMATTGDGLRICEEYRGFILDGGPGITTPGQHKRLSIARKEMLVECSAEQNLSLAGQNPALQTFALLEAMKDVSEFYRDPAKGASIDLYWVEDEIIQNQNFIFYQGNAFPVKDAREWFGTCEYNRKENGSNITIGGSGVPAHDRAWRSFAQDAHDKFYNGDPPIGKIPKLQQDNRNPSLERFLKLLLPSRLGYVEGGVRLVNGVEEIDPNALRYLNDGFDHAAGEPSGARISVAALADEGMGNYWATFHRHLTQDEFNRLVRRAISHELGHLIHQNHYMVPHGDSIMDDLLLVLPDTTVRGLSTSIWHAVEVGEIHLPGQSAGPLTP
jgi:hypothetical protein